MILRANSAGPRSSSRGLNRLLNKVILAVATVFIPTVDGPAHQEDRADTTDAPALVSSHDSTPTEALTAVSQHSFLTAEITPPSLPDALSHLVDPDSKIGQGLVKDEDDHNHESSRTVQVPSPRFVAETEPGLSSFDAITTSSSSGTAPIFAMIIGIDKYQVTDRFSTLRGAVNDARDFERYLSDPRDKGGLQVPTSNIVRLENEQATRFAILETFKSHFLANPCIPDHGNSVMILFYAGHGIRIRAPGNIIASDGMVEALCPVDVDTTDAKGNYVHAIPDYVLGWLLRELSEKKGNNITVVLDACRSGGMGRGVRRADDYTAIPLDLDSHLWKDKPETAQSYGMWSMASTSHVLLAACGEGELALEFEHADNLFRGRFTDSLITWLRRLSLENTTSVELIDHLPSWPPNRVSSGQTPQCVGAMRGRLLFSANYPPTGPRPVRLTPHHDGGVSDPLNAFRVNMGSVDGVVPGTEFSALTPNNTFLRTLVAHSVSINHTILGTKDGNPFKLPAQALAEVSDWKNNARILRIYTHPDFPYTINLFPTSTITHRSSQGKYVQEQRAQTADIIMRSDSENIVIQIRDQHEVCVPLQGNIAHLPKIADGLADFIYFLRHHNGNALLAGVSLEMHRLVGNFPGREPDHTAGPAGNGNLVANCEARFSSMAGDMYGFTIRNESYNNLFPYLFYFDPAQYSIALWYAPASDRVGPPLKRYGTVTIGMGGDRAFEFTPPPGQASSSGILKLFVATVHLNVEWIQRKASIDPKFEGTPRIDAVRSQAISIMPDWNALDVILTVTSRGGPLKG